MKSSKYRSDPIGLLTSAGCTVGMPRMQRSPLLFLLILSLTGCQGGMPKLFWDADENKPAYAQGKADGSQADSRMPLDVPPDLQGEVKVPEAERPLSAAGVDETKTVAGKAVSLNARAYQVPVDRAFSAAVDAMTALSLPVQSVDSPSGTITTEWVRRDSGRLIPVLSNALSMFGAGPTHTRYRFVVRVFRLVDGGSRIEIRTLGQQYINRHWVNRALKRTAVKEIFSAIEQRLPQAALKK